MFRTGGRENEIRGQCKIYKTPGISLCYYKGNHGNPQQEQSLRVFQPALFSRALPSIEASRRKIFKLRSHGNF